MMVMMMMMMIVMIVMMLLLMKMLLLLLLLVVVSSLGSHHDLMICSPSAYRNALSDHPPLPPSSFPIDRIKGRKSPPLPPRGSVRGSLLSENSA
jgi:hypothetical protein